MGQSGGIRNSIGMQLCLIPRGTYLMGNDSPLRDDLISPSCFRFGDFDERPVHRVSLSCDFYLGAKQVTNAEYERFDPSHRKLRGRLGFSSGDDEAAVFVSWHDADAFCRWLSEKEGESYRLPTEAEWEYACRAGTRTPFHTGHSLPEEMCKNQRRTWFPDPSRSAGENVVSLEVSRFSPNAWGLYAMHGNVEEWCIDWYAPYEEADQTDPTGPMDGDFRVTRGGSHSTDLYYLRSSNRSAALPDEKSWLIGFRVVQGGSETQTRRFSSPPLQRHQINVLQNGADETIREVEKPLFSGPRRYVQIPTGSYGPMFSRHNHDPAICECPNGDILAVWYSCVEESGRELGILASRLRQGEAEWEPASPFWDAPDRNDHAPALWCDGQRVYHFNGISAAATWGPLCTILRVSDDSGSTWSKALRIIREHGPRHMPIPSVFSLRDGTIVLPCDAVTIGRGGTALWMSENRGETWFDAGGTIAGIHASAAELSEGKLLAFGRGDEIEGKMPMSISTDRGRSWTYTPSPFPPITSGQRLVLKRIHGICEGGENPLLFVSFANGAMDGPDAYTITGTDGAQRPVQGMFCALSFDDGLSWPYQKTVSDGGPPRAIETLDGRPCTMGPDQSEPLGYLAACQAKDGSIHLISSTNHYTFNLAWLIS